MLLFCMDTILSTHRYLCGIWQHNKNSFISLYGGIGCNFCWRVTVISEWSTPEKTGIIRVVLREVNIHIDMELTTNEGYEQQVIHYLKQTWLWKSWIFTLQRMQHSDHIGSGSGRRRYGEDCRTGKESKDRLVKIAAPWDGIITIHRIS